MNLSGIWTITSFTFRESIRAKWLLVFSVVFFLLAVNIPMLVLLAVRYVPPDYLQIYLATLVAITFPFIPLLSLPMGATSIVDERESGTLQYMLSNPITKAEFFLGRAIGLLFATSAVIFLGFGIASIIVYNVDLTRYDAVAGTMLIAASLNIIMLALALIISILTKRKATAMGIAIFMWFLFTVLSDLGLLSVIVNLRSGAIAVLPIILLNPVESTRILAVLQLGGGFDQLGTTGLILSQLLGSSASGVILSTVAAWIVALFVTGFFIFRHQDLA